MPQVSAAPPAANWQWSDAGPAVIVTSADMTTTGAPVASLSLICNSAVPSIMVTWDAAVASGAQTSLSYRFDTGLGRDMSANAIDPHSQMVNDPIAVSRFIDEASASRQLVLHAGAAQATFPTADDAGILRRFRTACPDGTN